MNNKGNKHENYELLNLLGYGLAKFDNEFIKPFGFHTKTAFFEHFVELNIVETGSVVKNRMDLFDPFFDNARKGWWQKGEAYIHRKLRLFLRPSSLPCAIPSIVPFVKPTFLMNLALTYKPLP